MTYQSTEFSYQEAREIFTVSQLNRMIKELLEGSFLPVWIEGEISNFSQPSSGHIYFSLKDAAAQVRCAMFRGQNRQLTFQPKNGSHVLVQAQISLYEERGDYQLIITSMEETGDGALRRAFEALKQKLLQEGLFDAAHKKPLPSFPRQIGVVTSPTGAAVRDILTVLNRRFPALPIIIYPTQVQGSQAAAQIVQAISIANLRNECDVLILARGGGSLEDLWPFNEEIVARAIFSSTIPIVCGVGHEIDVTMADFVADQRAPTPSAAAELVSPDQNEWQDKFAKFAAQLQRHLSQQLQLLAHRLEGLQKRLRHPGQRIQEQMQQVDHLEQRLQQSMSIVLHKQQAKLADQLARLRQASPQSALKTWQSKLATLQQSLNFSIQNRLLTSREQFNQLARALHNVSPLATLQRGYAIVTDQSDKVISKIGNVRAGDKINARLVDGQLRCEVLEIIS